MPHFVFIQQISILNILNILYNLHFFFSSKCRLFHNATLFGFCITYILNTGCAKIWKKKSVTKRLIYHYVMHQIVFDIWYFELIQNHLPGCLQFCFENNCLFCILIPDFHRSSYLQHILLCFPTIGSVVPITTTLCSCKQMFIFLNIYHLNPSVLYSYFLYIYNSY